MDKIYVINFGEYYGGYESSYHKTEKGARKLCISMEVQDFLLKLLFFLSNKEFNEILDN